MNPLLLLLLLILLGCAFSAPDERLAAYKRRAENVTIVRDNWGIPHVYGKRDADAVFGVMYAQCEESFERVEKAYLEKLGRLSEVEGKGYLLQDLKMRLLYDTTSAIADYHKSPPWLKELLQAFSDGIHYYLHTHPDVEPLLLTRFEPWFPLLFTDGAYMDTQTGGLQVADMKELFGKDLTAQAFLQSPETAVGSNGFALAPSRTTDGSAMLYINPHVSFYFRTEMHMVSEEGLNAYGAVTWGQFFVFQGFNESCGWMHTSTAVDAADLYEEKIIRQGGKTFYLYDGNPKPLVRKSITITYKEKGKSSEQHFETFATHHGPVMGSRGGKWLTLKAQNRSLNGLQQSWLRTKAKNLQEFMQVMQLKGNSSTNTMYADKEGNIGYWHGNFVPRRASRYDPALPLDGSTSQTEWQGLHSLDDLVHSVNPKEGFLQNCNSSPFSVAGGSAIDKEKFPSYMAPEGENFRSLHAVQLLSQHKGVTLDELIRIGYSPSLSAFDTLLPPLISAYAAQGPAAPADPVLKEAIDSLKLWDKNAAVSSVATTIGVLWAGTVLSQSATVPDSITNDHVKFISWAIRHTSDKDKITALTNLLTALKNAFGTWKVPWGQINRFQRLDGSEALQFDHNKESVPVGLGPAYLGSLPSYETVWQGNQQFGVAGNSFVAAVSFGQRLKAKSISTGGQSFASNSKHFSDQAERFLNGVLKDVYFYREDVLRHAEKSYHPGEK